MADLVSLEDAKAQARTTHAEEDNHLQLLLTVAQGIVLNHVNQRVDEDEAAEWSETVNAWTADDVPDGVRAAILWQFAAMARGRGDDDPKTSPLDEHGLAKGVAGLLSRYRDPAVA